MRADTFLPLGKLYRQEGLKIADMSSQKAILLARFIGQYVMAVRKYCAAARSGKNTEALHQLRVNTRRLRNMIKFFHTIFPKKKIKQWDKRLKEVAAATGTARDLDVYCVYLRKYKSRLKGREQKKALERAIRKVVVKRKKLQPKIAKALDRLGKEGILDDVSIALRKLSGRLKQNNESRLYKMCRKGMFKRVKALLEFDPIVRQPSKVEELHQMRLAAKHVRYSLEGIQEIYGAELKSFLRHVLAVHKQLGEVHDYDVWGDQWIRFLEKQIVHAKEKALIKQLKAHFRTQRVRSYRAFVRQWSRIKRERVLEGLMEHAYAF